MKYVTKNIEDFNPEKKRNILILFDDMAADVTSNKKLRPVMTELFSIGREINISFGVRSGMWFLEISGVPEIWKKIP